MAKGSKTTGSGTQYKRGFTTQSQHAPEVRPPNLQGRVYNEFRPEVARGSTMPPPTGDTQEPRMSKRLGRTSRR
jgi:hypothetical protein